MASADVFEARPEEVRQVGGYTVPDNGGEITIDVAAPETQQQAPIAKLVTIPPMLAWVVGGAAGYFLARGHGTPTVAAAVVGGALVADYGARAWNLSQNPPAARDWIRWAVPFALVG